MTSDDVVEHLPLVLYLAAVVLLSIRLFPFHARSFTSILFILLALGALATTWTFMIRYMFASFRDGRALRPSSEERAAYTTTIWLKETSLFKQAWEYVCATPERWWISSQLCTFTGGLWTAFLFAEGSRTPALRRRAWQYMFLGQIVAISFASSSFLAAMRAVRSSTMSAGPAKDGATTQQSTRDSQPPVQPVSTPRPTLLLVLSIGIAFATTFYVPATIGQPSFLLNLLGMHAVLFLPLWQIAYTKPASQPAVKTATTKGGLGFVELYTGVAFLSLAVHAKNCLPLIATTTSLADFGERIATAWNSYPSQQSISWDVAWTNGIWQLWSLIEFAKLVPLFRNAAAGQARGTGGRSEAAKAGLLRRTAEALLALVAIVSVPSLGSAVGISVFLALREKWLGETASRSRAVKAE